MGVQCQFHRRALSRRDRQRKDRCGNRRQGQRPVRRTGTDQIDAADDQVGIALIGNSEGFGQRLTQRRRQAKIADSVDHHRLTFHLQDTHRRPAGYRLDPDRVRLNHAIGYVGQLHQQIVAVEREDAQIIPKDLLILKRLRGKPLIDVDCRQRIIAIPDGEGCVTGDVGQARVIHVVRIGHRNTILARCDSKEFPASLITWLTSHIEQVTIFVTNAGKRIPIGKVIDVAHGRIRRRRERIVQVVDDAR